MSIRATATSLGGTAIQQMAGTFLSGWRAFSDTNVVTVALQPFVEITQMWQPSSFLRPEDDGNGVWNGWSRSFLDANDNHNPPFFSQKPRAQRGETPTEGPMVRVKAAQQRASRW